MTNGRISSNNKLAIYLGLGSNVGDREANLREAIDRIRRLGIEVIRESSIYETQPVDYLDQPWFLNQVIQGSILSEIEPESGPVTENSQMIATVQTQAVLSKLLDIEHAMGRKRETAGGPRVIDIDLLLLGDMVIEHSKDAKPGAYMKGIDVVVPHPRLHLRRFVLEPLCEISPELVHPLLNKTCREILGSLDDPSTVRLYEKR